MALVRAIFLDDDSELRAVVVELLALIDVACDAIASVPELKDRLEEARRPYDVAILDINLGPRVPSGLDAYRCLRAMGFAGRIAFLTGHAGSHPLVEEANRLGDALVYAKPITLASLRRILFHDSPVATPTPHP
jgi:CheY-like chemotaxis protein